MFCTSLGFAASLVEELAENQVYVKVIVYQIRSSDLPMVITALYLPDLKDILDNPNSRETLAHCVYRLYVLAKEINAKG